MTVKHIGIILDGNRRWAKKHGLPPWKGHEKGAEKLKDILEWCNEIKLNELTLYTFSTQNFQRSQEEVDELMRIFRTWFSDLLKQDNLKKLHEAGARIRFIGRVELFPADIQHIMRDLMDKTSTNSPRAVNFAMGYGGREEIVDAVKQIAQKAKKGSLSPDTIDKNTISKHLYLNSEPDLIIRTGGAKRTSNFLIWQSWYSEWFFVQEMLPELSKERFLTIIEEFGSRERRYGK